MEDWKIKIAVLWSLLEFCMIAISMVENYLIFSGEMIAEDTIPELMLVLVIVFLIPPIMAFLSLTLKDSINRWLNIIAGAVFAVLVLADPIMYLTEQSAYSAYVTLIGIVEFVAAVSIVWFAWKSKQKT